MRDRWDRSATGVPFEEDVVLPEQMARRSQAISSGVRALLVALLYSGIQDAEDGGGRGAATGKKAPGKIRRVRRGTGFSRSIPGGGQLRRRDEAREWIRSTSRTDIFDFEVVCDLLELNGTVVRETLEKSWAAAANA